MKRNFFAVTAASLLLVALASFVSCDSDEDIWYEAITVYNRSDHDVTDLQLGWDGLAGGTPSGHGPASLDVLRKGEEHTFTVGVFDGGREGTTRFGVFYTINGRRFDSWDDNLSLLDREHQWPSRLLKEGFPGIIIIGNDGFELEGGVPAPPYRGAINAGKAPALNKLE